jgi:hypothetical protein
VGLWTTEPGPPNPSRCFSHDRTEGRGKGPDDTLLLCCHIHHRQIVQSDTSPGFGYGMNQWTRGGGGMYDTLLSDTLCPNGLTESDTSPVVWLNNKPMDLSVCVSELSWWRTPETSRKRSVSR